MELESTKPESSLWINV